MSLVAQNLRFAYGDVPVVDGLSLTLSPGEIVGVVGPNGAGKSTLVRLLAGGLEPSSGVVTLDDKNISSLTRFHLARRLAVVPQGGTLPGGFRVHEIVTMGRTPHVGLFSRETTNDMDVVTRALHRTDTWRLRDRRADALSGGEQQRVVLARALAQDPDYLLLDEPTNHLDLRYQVDVLRFVRREAARGVGALVVLHDLNLAARACHRLVVLAKGREVAHGTPHEVLRAERLRDVYHTDVHVFAEPDTDLPVVLPKL
ncbi:MAG: heme ABC transporter ATP-binding protein [Trueperaceae bacterium]|nr:heme ABC transporter ATP-binding protein [Trueperaceae bacterium]